MSMYGKYPKVNGKEQVARPSVDCSGDKVLTVQSDADEANINKIVAKMEKGQMSFRMNAAPPFYGDVSEFDGLADAVEKVLSANDLFMDMSASIRERFDNDPVKMVEFLEDEANRAEAIKLGMVIEEPVAPVAPAAPPAP